MASTQTEMVRVLSVHNFESQSIQTCEDPVAVTTAPPERLLVALNHHVIEVRDLSPNSQPPFTFPTVDQVSSLIHCTTGNYVATLEVKVGREGREVIYTRIYANWDQPEILNSPQPMRARIAGCVTPSSSQTGGDSLEMIELPVKFPNTTAIACCQATGNLIVASSKILCLFQLVSRLHDISRQRFLDFELWPVTLELNFAPSKLAMVENIVAAMDTDSHLLHVFKINKGVSHRSDQSSSYSGSPLRSHSTASGSTRSGEKRPVVPEEQPLDLDAMFGIGGQKRDGPLMIHLPTIRMSNLSKNGEFRPSPFKPSYMVSMGVAIKEMPTNEPWAEQMTTMVESLLQLEVEDVNEDKLYNLVLRPLYHSADSDSTFSSGLSLQSHLEWSCPRLRSAHYNRLVGIDCLICTHQEGFLYHFSVGACDTVNLGECITVYNFTSPVHYVCMEAGLLHAITSSGLETYTMRSTHAVHLTHNQVAPSVDDPVSLIGLRPFIGVIGLLLTEQHLVILASSEANSASWTIYSLVLPPIEQLYSDMVSIATTYKDTTPSMYRQLLGEAHIVIKTASHLSTSPIAEAVSEKIKGMYKQSCILLAHSFLMSDTEADWDIGTKYIVMSGTTPDEFLKWLEGTSKLTNFDSKLMLGVSHYFTKCLGQWPDRLPQSVVSALAEQLEPVQLAQLLLKSPAFVSCATENIRQRLLKSSEPECCLAVGLVTESGGVALQRLPDEEEINTKLINILVEHSHLLFDSMRHRGNEAGDNKMKHMTFSELSVLLMQEKPNQLALALARLTSEKIKMEMEHILQIFMTYLPSRIGLAGASASAGVVLQMFLEEVLLFGSEKPNTSLPHVQDALKILMRSYLSDVKFGSSKDKNLSRLGIADLPKFIKELPCDPTESISSTVKLQWLLWKGWLDTKALSELNQFVYDFLPNCLSLQVLGQPQEAIQLLLDKCPSAVVLYGKEMIKNNSDWEMLLKQLKERSVSDKDGVYTQLFQELLTWLSESGQLCNVLPPEERREDEYRDYVLTCQQVRHAEHIHCMIMATGEHLLNTLNL